MSVQTDIKTIESIRAAKDQRLLTALTAYDAITARLLDESGIDLILVGDSLNMVFAGEQTTIGATLEQMIYHSTIVRKAVQKAVVITDMPFLTYQVSHTDAIQNCGRVLKETGVHGVKIEGGMHNRELIMKLTRIGIPVMGHIGLTPQSIHQIGSYKTQGVTEEDAMKLQRDAEALSEAGCFCIVLEKVPAELASKISNLVSIPTIGIGAGPSCDGQILVTEDLLGLFDTFKPKFVRRYNNLAEQIRKNLSSFIDDVQQSRFPGEAESY